MKSKIIPLLSYEMPKTWINTRDQQLIFDDRERITWKEFDRMREALSMVVEPWRYGEYDLS